ncbi:MAG TPA: hypothetical protein VE198_20985 [Actinoallomurus sp.]|jgi:hypothetical protein|nr:hypothetical protein [Actinoallomurus sp.]
MQSHYNLVYRFGATRPGHLEDALAALELRLSRMSWHGSRRRTGLIRSAGIRDRAGRTGALT